MKVFYVEKSNFNVHFEWKGYDENGDDVMQKYVTYTGEKSYFYYTDPLQHIKDNQAIPEWKCKLISEHKAKKGATKGIQTKYLFTGEAITILD